MPWLMLAAAIACEVVATTSLKLSMGFTRLVPSIIVVVGYVAAVLLLSQALVRGMQVSIAYAIWAAAGIALVALIGTFFLGETMSWIQVGGLVLVVAGVMALELGGQP